MAAIILETFFKNHDDLFPALFGVLEQFVQTTFVILTSVRNDSIATTRLSHRLIAV